MGFQQRELDNLNLSATIALPGSTAAPTQPGSAASSLVRRPEGTALQGGGAGPIGATRPLQPGVTHPSRRRTVQTQESSLPNKSNRTEQNDSPGVNVARPHTSGSAAAASGNPAEADLSSSMFEMDADKLTTNVSRTRKDS